MKKDIKKIVKKIKKSKKIAITSHIRPDGDSISSGIALYLILKKMNKKVRYINKDRTPHPLSSFPGAKVIEYGNIYPKDFDLVILIECSTEDRSDQKNLDKYDRILIDHHVSNDGKVELNWVNPEESAVAIMIYELAGYLGIKVDKTMASLLYAGIVSDTGGFRFTNINAKTFKIASELIKLGADPINTNKLLFENYTPQKVELMSKVLSTLEMKFDNKVALIYMYRKFLDELGIDDVESEDIITIVRSINTVKLVIFFKENKDNTFRVSLRSRGNIDSSILAESFGGGGHKHASGFYLKESLQKTKDDILKKLKRFFSQANN